MPRIDRLEVWTTYQCAGGQRVAIIGDRTRVSTRRSVTGESTLSVALPLASPAASAVMAVANRVLRLVRVDGSWSEWRLRDRADGSGADADAQLLTVIADHPLVELAAGMVRTISAGGLSAFDVGASQLTPSEIIDIYVLPALAEQGSTWITRGTVDSSTRLNLDGDWLTPLALLRWLAEPARAKAELDLRPVGTTAYAIDLLTAIGSAAPPPRIQTRKNLLSTKRRVTRTGQATRIYGKGAPVLGVPSTIERTLWEVSAVDTVTRWVTLVDPLAWHSGAAGPFTYDDQLNGWRLMRELTGRTFTIQDTDAVLQRVQLDDVSSIAVGERVSFRVSDALANTRRWWPLSQAGQEYAYVTPTSIVGSVVTVTHPHTAIDPVTADNQARDWRLRRAAARIGTVDAVTAAVGTSTLETYNSVAAVAIGDQVRLDGGAVVDPAPWTYALSAYLRITGIALGSGGAPHVLTVVNWWTGGAQNFNGDVGTLRVWRAVADATPRVISAASAAANTVTLSAVTALALGDLCEVVQPCGGVHPVALDAVPQVTTYGPITAPLALSDVGGATNLVPNGWFRRWSAGMPVGWTRTGTGAVTQINDPTLHGGVGMQVVFRDTTLGVAVNTVTSPDIPVVPQPGQTMIALRIRIRIDAALATTLQVLVRQRMPDGTLAGGLALSTTTLTEWDGSANPAATVAAVGIREIVSTFDVANVIGPLVVTITDGTTSGAVTRRMHATLDAVQITQTASDVGTYVEAALANDLWRAVQRELLVAADPQLEYTVSLVDLERIDDASPSRWYADAIALGGLIDLRDTDLGLTATPRVLELECDELAPESASGTRVVLSSRRSDLTTLLAQRG